MLKVIILVLVKLEANSLKTFPTSLEMIIIVNPVILFHHWILVPRSILLILESPCCNSAMLPWFHKVLNSPTDDYIEARVCADESTAIEDIPIDLINVFVK